MKLIEIKNLALDISGKRILKDINLEIEEGSKIGIIGRSAAGKSALMHSIRGVKGYAPTKGKIFYNVQVCNRCLNIDAPNYNNKCQMCGEGMKFKQIDFWSSEGKKYHNLIKRRFGMMFQEATGLYSMRSVRENVIEALRAAGCPEEKRKDKVLEILKSVSLLHRLRHIVRDLSGGEKQRLVLARQIAKDPPLLLLDEPTGTLDKNTSKHIYDVLKDFSKDRTTLIASHLTSYIHQIAPSSLLLSKGEIIMKGSTVDVIKKFSALEGKRVERKRKEVKKKIKIKCRNTKKYYHTVDEGYIKALDGINLEIYEGEIHGIVGETGAGKTTLVNIIAGKVAEYEGNCRVRTNGEEVEMKERGPEYRGKAKEITGVIPQQYGLFSYFTVYKNLHSSMPPDIPDEIGEEMVEEMMGVVGFSDDEIDSILRKYPDEISEGEKQRVILALILLKNPKIVILDEPTGTLDKATMMDVAESIIRTREELGTTFLIVSHDIEFVKAICDRVTVMDAGRKKYTGDVTEAIDFALDKDFL